MAPEQKRVFDRIEIPLKIQYEIVENPPLIIKDADMKDISGGGIRLSLEEEIAVGTHIKLDIEMPGDKSKTITAYGKVVWVSKAVQVIGPKSAAYYETGIQFTKVDPLAMGKILKNIKGK